MHTPLARREFLKHGAAVTAVLGFPFWDHLTGADTPEKAPADLLTLARERMKQEAKPGVIIVIPPDAKAAQRLANDLAGLLGAREMACGVVEPIRHKNVPAPVGAGNPAAQRLFCQAVFVCLPFEQARRAAPDLAPDTAAVLLDVAGKPVETIKTEPTLFGKDFVARMSSFIYGKEGQHLAAVVQAQRGALGKASSEQVDAAVRDLDSNTYATRETASRRLAELAPRATALLAAALQTNPPLEPRRRIERILDDVYAAAPPEKPGPRLPYGVQWQARAFDPCPGCGLSSAPLPSRQFLRFVTEKPK
jgi:hypothetical protein